MNSRDNKLFRAGGHYHIYNRGAGGADIFKESQDYIEFIIRLRLALGHEPSAILELAASAKPLRIKPVHQNAFTVVSYCLMPNHFHLLIRQNSDISVSRLISKVCTSYAMYFNSKYKREGSLFHDAFKSVSVDESYDLLWLSAYIHQNPATAGLVWDLSDWKWSSYPEYISKKRELCDMEVLMIELKHRDQYREFVENSFNEMTKVKSSKTTFID
jgi:putative transposase